MNGTPQAGIGGQAKCLGKAWSRTPCGCLIAVDRQGDHPRMAPGDEVFDEFYRFIGTLGAEQADAQSNGRQSVLRGSSEPCIEGLYQFPGPALPCGPVRGIDDQVCVTGTVRRQSLAKPIGRLDQAVPSAGET